MGSGLSLSYLSHRRVHVFGAGHDLEKSSTTYVITKDLTPFFRGRHHGIGLLHVRCMRGRRASVGGIPDLHHKFTTCVRIGSEDVLTRGIHPVVGQRADRVGSGGGRESHGHGDRHSAEDPQSQDAQPERHPHEPTSNKTGQRQFFSKVINAVCAVKPLPRKQ